jgi:hypothetical protein
MSPEATPHAGASRFAEHERRLLLAEPGIGPQVVQRLEGAGIHSLAQLREAGVPRAVMAVCSSVGSIGWANRRRPLERVLERVAMARASRCR